MNKNKLGIHQVEWAMARHKDGFPTYYAKAKSTPKTRMAIKKSHCKVHKLEFDLTEGFFANIPTTCPQCGKVTTEKERDSTMSLDRLNPELGYVVGNVEWICMVCNRRKQDMTYFEMLEFAKRGIERNEA